MNVLRYRGYVYDEETNLYYLQSRYYSPTTCRFVNADGQINVESGLLGCNIFAYANNNPINYFDPLGDDAINLTYYGWNDRGIPIVGHSALLFQDAGGDWWYTEFAGDNKKEATVNLYKLENMGEKISDYDQKYDIVSCLLRFFRIGGFNRTELKGDYSACLAIAQDLQGSNYNGYNLFTNNCLDYVQELLQAAEGNHKWANAYHDIAITPVPISFAFKTKLLIGAEDAWHWIKETAGKIEIFGR